MRMRKRSPYSLSKRFKQTDPSARRPVPKTRIRVTLLHLPTQPFHLSIIYLISEIIVMLKFLLSFEDLSPSISPTTLKRAKISMKNKFDAIKEIKYDFVEYFNRNEIDNADFCKVLALCHSTKTRRHKKVLEDGSESYSLVHDYTSLEDETILNLARKCGCSFEAALRIGLVNAYKIVNNLKLEYYQVLGINYSTSKRQRFSIVFRKEPLNIQIDECQERATLYIRGSFESMKDLLLLKECEKETLKEMTESFTQLGYMTMIYGKKELTQLETENYTKLMIIYNSSLTMEDYEAEKIFSSFEENITFLSMICLETKLEKGSMEMIQTLKSAKIKTSLLSGSDYTQSLVAAYKTGILSSDQEIYHLQGENFETVLFGIKTLLHKLKKIIQKFVDTDSATLLTPNSEHESNSNIFLNYYILFSAKTFSVILQNNYLYYHFLFLLEMSCGVIAYQFDPITKKKLLKMVSDNFVFKPGLLSLGFCSSDLEMFQKSSFAIENKIGNNLCSHSGDLIVAEKSSIIEILFHDAFVHKKMVLFIMSNMLYLFFMLNWPLLISFLSNCPMFSEFLNDEWICNLIFLLAFCNLAIISMASEENKKNLDVTTISSKTIFKKNNEKFVWAYVFIDKLFSSIVDSLYLFIIWSYYQHYNDQDILMPSFFLPKILQFNTFINFSMNVFHFYFEI